MFSGDDKTPVAINSKYFERIGVFFCGDKNSKTGQKRDEDKHGKIVKALEDYRVEVLYNDSDVHRVELKDLQIENDNKSIDEAQVKKVEKTLKEIL